MAVTAFLDHVDVDHINARARQVRFTAVLARLIVTVLFTFGWLTAKLFSVAWFAIAWMAVAVAEGWNAGRAEAKNSRRE